jgi:syntaxin 5
MFDDPSTEIDELTGVIKQEIQTLKTAIAELERVSGRSRDENKQTLDHSHTVVDNLRARLKDTTLEFKEVLTLRTDNLKAHKNRRQLFTNAPEEGDHQLVATVPRVRCQVQGYAAAFSMLAWQVRPGH